VDVGQHRRANALQGEQALLGQGAAIGREATAATVLRQDAMAGDHQRHGIARERLADRPGSPRKADAACDLAITRRLAPADRSGGLVHRAAELANVREVDRDGRELDPLPREMAPDRRNQLLGPWRWRTGTRRCGKTSFGRHAIGFGELQPGKAPPAPGDAEGAERGLEQAVALLCGHADAHDRSLVTSGAGLTILEVRFVARQGPPVNRSWG
jgi:hypothetical protein